MQLGLELNSWRGGYPESCCRNPSWAIETVYPSPFPPGLLPGPKVPSVLIFPNFAFYFCYRTVFEESIKQEILFPPRTFGGFISFREIFGLPGQYSSSLITGPDSRFHFLLHFSMGTVCSYQWLIMFPVLNPIPFLPLWKTYPWTYAPFRNLCIYCPDSIYNSTWRKSIQL